MSWAILAMAPSFQARQDEARATGRKGLPKTQRRSDVSRWAHSRGKFVSQKYPRYPAKSRMVKKLSPTAIAQADAGLRFFGHRPVQSLDRPSSRPEAMLVAAAASGPP